MKKYGSMAPNLMDILRQGKKMAMVNLLGQMVQAMLVILKITILRVMELINGMMKELIQVNGKKTRCMGKVYLIGKMGKYTRVNTKMI